MSISIRNLQKKLPINPTRVRKAVLKALAPKTTTSAEISVCFVTGRRIRKLNARYLKQNASTDVIAFDLSGSNGRLRADIVVSTDAAVRNANVYRTHPLYELYLYVVHGALHLAGFRDRGERSRMLMQKKAEEILSSLHVYP